MYLANKPGKADPNEARLSRFTCCALSGEPLAAPAVVDRLGNLFNKEPLVEALLHKRLPKALSHIRGPKDMIPIHLHRRALSHQRALSHLRSIRHRRCLSHRRALIHQRSICHRRVLRHRCPVCRTSLT
ncbi:replication termination factor 2 [Lolium perenne]|uniref:replication termination factor 2 n=1 Tax=Lolium perenne TaxID=4522 RepID=UPI003A99DC71